MIARFLRALWLSPALWLLQRMHASALARCDEAEARCIMDRIERLSGW